MKHYKTIREVVAVLNKLNFSVEKNGSHHYFVFYSGSYETGKPWSCPFPAILNRVWDETMGTWSHSKYELLKMANEVMPDPATI